MAANPYQSLPEQAFWKTGVAQHNMFEIGPLWDPKEYIAPGDPVATFGSCFAQHIGRALKKRNYNWMQTEARPWGLSDANAKKFNFEVFTARTGNIYTTSLLLQWVRWALGSDSPPEEIWESGGRFYDPFRPVVEPNGFESVDEVLVSREATLRALRQAIRQSRFFVFTLGLTESWKNSQYGYEYPMCPGTVAGSFDPDLYRFENQQFDQVLGNLRGAVDLILDANNDVKFILTVSPVPLTATNSGRHVLPSTMWSKSVLYAVAGQMARNRAEVDYFPSYELVNSPVFKGSFFEPNMRSVSQFGVDFVMDHFFRCQEAKFGPAAVEKAAEAKAQPETKSRADVVCEEELLAAFGK